MVDSLAEYHHLKPGKGGTGFLIGAGVGMLFGALIGAVLYKPAEAQGNSLSATLTSIGNASEEANSILTGGIIGLLGGGLIGTIAGANSKIDVDIDLRKYSKDDKKKLMIELLKP